MSRDARRLCVRVAAALAIPLTFSALGCGGNPPDKEITQAQAAIEAARGAGAPKCARAEFVAAQGAPARAGDATSCRENTDGWCYPEVRGFCRSRSCDGSHSASN